MSVAIAPDRHKPLLLLVDDQPDNLDILVNYLEHAGMDLIVALDGTEALVLAQQRLPSLILLDVMMPGMDGYEVCRRMKSRPALCNVPVIFMSALGDLDSKVEGFDSGGVDYVTKPLQREELLARINTHLTLRQQRCRLEQQNAELEQMNRQLQHQIDRRQQAESALQLVDEQLSTLSKQEALRWGIDAFIGQSAAIQAVLNEVRALLAASNTNVLVLGESGTGKELVSRAVHFGSERKLKPFVAVNCAAIPAELADAELFGHSKGAFTGALQERHGYFVQADGGTLFLDEIGDMPLALQAKLLRVLENGEVCPVGSTKTRKVNVRIVAATNLKLMERVQDKSFRADLYYRLAGYTIQLPALRERLDDIPLLVNHFVQSLGRQMGRDKTPVSAAAIAALQQYSFPGNIRELRNMVEYALIACRGGGITPAHWRFIAAAPAIASATPEVVVEDSFGGQEQCILDYVRQHQRIDNRAAQALLQIQHGRASYLLKKLHREGKLVRCGERRWAYYQLSP